MKSRFLFTRHKRLVERWKGQNRRIEAITAALAENRDWTQYLLANTDEGWNDLEELETCSKRTVPGECAPRDLRGVTLRDIYLENTSRLADTCLDYAVLDGISLKGASLRGASLRGSRMQNQTNLEEVKFSFCDLRQASFRDTWMPGADISNSDISGTDFIGAALTRTSFSDVRFNEEGIFGSIGRGKYWTRFGGERQRADEFSVASDPDLVQYARDQIGQFALRKRHPALARVAYMITNFGSSPGRLCCWVLSAWLIFGLLYNTQCIKDKFTSYWASEILEIVSPVLIDSSTRELVRSPGRLLYFSIITLTTVGYGDVVPDPQDWKGQMYVGLEALLGYVLLGAFVSLLLRGILASRD